MIYAEILAGGQGSRMGYTDMPKQFLNIGSKPIVIHTLETFLVNERIDYILIVTPKEWITHTNDIIENYINEQYIKKVFICEGGENRNDSVMKGIDFIEEKFSIKDEDIIITHDAVRPFVTNRIINENIDLAYKYHAVDTAIKSSDTIVKSLDNITLSEIPNRENMYQGQTPQTFNIKKLKYLYESLDTEMKNILTDAAKIFVINNEKVYIAKGDVFNMKITTKHDLIVANYLVNGVNYDKSSL